MSATALPRAETQGNGKKSVALIPAQLDRQRQNEEDEIAVTAILVQGNMSAADQLAAWAQEAVGRRSSIF